VVVGAAVAGGAVGGDAAGEHQSARADRRPGRHG
jgi:hypothetical protein